MHRIDTENNVAGAFADKDAAVGQGATVVSSEWLNTVQENIVQTIEASTDLGGPTLSKASRTQLTEAVTAFQSRSLAPGNWQSAKGPKAGTLFGVATGLATPWFGTERYWVAVGDAIGGDAQIAYAPDSIIAGTTWVEAANPKNKNLYAIAYGNGLFVAVGQPDGVDCYIVTSPDAINWTEQSNPKNKALYGICYGNGLFVAVGQADGVDAYIITSTDGVTWTERTNSQNVDLLSVAYSSELGMFVAVGGLQTRAARYILSSTNGTTWTQREITTNPQLRAVAYGSGLFLAVGESDGADGFHIAYSSDGTNWTFDVSASGGVAAQGNGIAFGAGSFVVVGFDNDGNPMIASTSDGLAWKDRVVPSPQDVLDGIVFGSSRFVTVGADDGVNAKILVSLRG